MRNLTGEISIDELLASRDNWVAIDVRSPAEFAEDTIPGAVNVPLLGDVDRKLVGTAYYHSGPDQARRLGLELVGPRLPGIVEAVEEVANGRPVAVFCWRGGLRSAAMSQVLRLMGIPAGRLTGGYRTYRQHVMEFFRRGSLPQPLTVLHGLTGSGKTEVLHYLREMGEAVIDLERLANHRGSVFGHIGLGAQPSQKAFETCLFQEFQHWQAAKTIVVECESRRVGKLSLPDAVFEEIRQGRRILVYDSLDGRVDRIIRDYSTGDVENSGDLQAALASLRERVSAKKLRELSDALAAGNAAGVVSRLLLEYYDQFYGYPAGPAPGYVLCVDAGQPEQAARQVAEYLKSVKLSRGRKE